MERWLYKFVLRCRSLSARNVWKRSSMLERGRFLTPQDIEDSSPVIVIDEQFARRHFGDQDPIGCRINIDILNTAAEIVGVVGHVRQWGLDENGASPYPAQCYLSVFQIPPRF